MSLPHRRTSVRRRARRTTGERTARAPLRRGRASTRDLHFDDVRDGLKRASSAPSGWLGIEALPVGVSGGRMWRSEHKLPLALDASRGTFVFVQAENTSRAAWSTSRQAIAFGLAVSTSALVAAYMISRSARLARGRRRLESLSSTLAILWHQSRCGVGSRQTSRTADQKPSAPPTTAATGARRPRRLRSRSTLAQPLRALPIAVLKRHHDAGSSRSWPSSRSRCRTWLGSTFPQ